MKWLDVSLIGMMLVFSVGRPGDAATMFQLRESVPVPAGYECLAYIGHLDGDGALDLVLWHEGGGGSYRVLERQGGSWGEGGSWVERFVYRQSPTRLVLVGNVDGDSRPEILSANYNSVTIHEATDDNVYNIIHQSSGYGSFIEQESRVGDSNGNGKQEFLIAREGGPARVSILEGSGDNVYTNLGSVTGTFTNCAVAGVADLDGDGRPELVFGDAGGSGCSTHVCKSGSLVYATTGFLAYSLGDTDGNGRMELIGMAGVLFSNVAILENTGGNTFQEVLSVPAVGSPAPPAGSPRFGALDVNGDGKTEILHTADTAGNVLSIDTRLCCALQEIWNSGELFRGSNDDISPFYGILSLGDTNGNGCPELAVLQGARLHILETVPEPSTLALLGIGAVGLLGHGWQQRSLRLHLFGRARVLPAILRIGSKASAKTTFACRLVLPLAILTLGVCPVASAERPYETAWIRQIGSGNSGVSADRLGNVYLVGNGWLAKYDAAGHLHWADPIGVWIGTAVSADCLGNVFVSGYDGFFREPSYDFDFDAFVLKYDAAGSLLWSRQVSTLELEVGRGVSADHQGGVYFVGDVWGGPDGSFLARYDSAGNPVWTRPITAQGSRGVSADSLGNVFVTGEAPGSDAFVAKYDAAGNHLWTRQIGSADFDWGEGVSADDAGCVYVAGTTQGSLAGPVGGSHDAFLAKYDTAGSLLWTRQLGTPYEDRGRAVSADGLGNVYIAGNTYGSLFGPNARIVATDDAFVAKYDGAGNLLWARQFGTPASDGSYGLSTDGPDTIYMSGVTGGGFVAPAESPEDAFLIKLAVPEPSTLTLLGIGAVGLLAYGWRRRACR